MAGALVAMAEARRSIGGSQLDFRTPLPEKRPAISPSADAQPATAATVKRQGDEVGRDLARLAVTTDTKHRAEMSVQAWGVDETFGLLTLLAGAYAIFRFLV